MRKPSSRCLNQTCSTLVHTWKYDVDGGRQVNATTTTTGVVCNVNPGDTAREAAALGRVTGVNPTVFMFPADPGLKPDDEILFSGSYYSVLGEQDEAGRGSCWTVNTILRE